jgi:IPT/TIG domain
MSLFKRRMSRRALGVVVGASLLLLGLEAPAFADTAVTAVAPTSGPDNCVVVVTGTGFRTFPDAQNDVTFVGPLAGTADDFGSADWFSISDTEIWAVVPAALVAGTTYTVQVTQPSGTFTAGGTFLSTGDTAPGGCAATIASFTPTCGSAGDVVTITGTNLLDASNLSGTNSGADVFFRSSAVAGETEATYPVPDQSSPTSIQAIVPSGVVDGPIRVLTDVDPNAATPANEGVFSTESFLTPPPDCPAVGGDQHARAITFKITKAGRTSGVVSSTEDPAFTDCVAAVPVKIQRKKGGAWRTVGKTTTDDSGAYVKKVKNPKGKQKFRALAPKVSLGDPVTDTCLKARSAVRTR